MTGKMFSSNQGDLIKAYAIIFTGNSAHDFRDLLNTDISVLKAAYRNRIMENHPDRSKVLGVNDRILTERFKVINRAYADLSNFIENAQKESVTQHHNSRPAGKNKAWPSHKRARRNTDSQTAGRDGTYNKRKQAPQNKTNASQHHHARKKSDWLPHNEVPLGQYLFFTRIISLTTLIEAIIWQRQQRPSYGNIALNWNLLTRNDISSVHTNRKAQEKFGECALRMGLLNSFQHRAILCKQKNLQKPIGQYFIEKNILTADELKAHLLGQKKHNQRVFMQS